MTWQVLQLKEIPPRPKEYDGALCLFDPKEGVDEAAVRAALSSFGEIASYEISPEKVIVRFSNHEAARAARRAAAQLTSICKGADTLYNERSYDGRHGEAGRDDDDGRGWFCFESAVSVELVERLRAFPRMKATLDHLPPKVNLLSSSAADFTLLGDVYLPPLL